MPPKDHPTHFLACSWNADLRTYRHHAIRKILAKFARKCDAETEEERHVGVRYPKGEPTSIIADLVMLASGKDMIIDVGITCASMTKAARWPSKDEVGQALLQEATERPTLEETLPQAGGGLSAGGVAGPSAMDVIDTLTRMFNPNDETEQLWFRSKLLGAMSCTLIRSANFHYHRHARRSVPASQ